MVKIFVGNLTEDCTNEDLKHLFSEYGKIKDCEKLLDKPYGFVHMEDYQDADTAARKLHRMAYKGKRLRVELSNSKPTKIFIGNVPHDCKSEDIRELFEKEGLEVHECDKVEGKGYGFAHVNSSKGFREINRVVRNLDKTWLKGRTLNIEISDNRRKEADAEREYAQLAQQYGYNYDDLGMDHSRSQGRGMGGGMRGTPYPVPRARDNSGGERGFGGFDEYYPMANHMNKMRGGFGGGFPADQVSLEGPFARGMGPAALMGPGVMGSDVANANALMMANEAEIKKRVDSTNKLAMKHAALFHHCSNAMLSMMETGQLSDYELICEGKAYKVHKLILAARSTKCVELMLINPQTSVIKDLDEDTLNLLLKFMYSGIVDVANINPTRIIKLLSAAEKYQVEMVKEGLEAALMDALDLNTVVDYLIIGEELELADLKSVALRFIGARSREMREREDFRLKLKDYPHLLMALFEAASGN